MEVAHTEDLASLLARAHSIGANASSDEIASLVAAIRTALAAGIASNQQALRSFLSVAHRFGHHADVWNTSQLLAEHGDLDGHVRSARVAAWMRLFPNTAIKRPKLALELLGGDGTGGVSDASRSGLLAGWLDWSSNSYARTGNTQMLVGSLLAARELANCWWPENIWEEVAPAFSAAFVDSATQVAALLRSGEVHETAGVGLALALALNLQLLLLEAAETDSDGDVEGGVTGTPVIADKVTGPGFKPVPSLSPDDLWGVAERLNQTKRRIWVVGAIKPKWQHLMGVAKSLGLESALFEHVGYQEVKQKAMIQRVNFVRDFGILLGPVPHSASGIGGHSSLATQLKQEAGVSVIELRSQSTSQELQITKSSFRTGLIRLLTEGVLESAA